MAPKPGLDALPAWLSSKPTPSCRIRHVKCDEEKPICRRCRDSGVKCDGYAPPPAPKKPARRRDVWVPVPESKQVIVFQPPSTPGAPIERYYLDHFHHWTSKQLTSSTDMSNFWMTFVLPLAHNCEPVRYAVSAVGAAHRFFMAGQDTRSPLQQLRGLAMQEYNKAISHIVPHMSMDSAFNIHCTLVCCILFIAFEGITGRYPESVRHLRAGNRLLALPALASDTQGQHVTRKLTQMFATLGVEASIFLEDNILPATDPPYRAISASEAPAATAFRDLDDANYELRKLDVEAVETMAEEPWETYSSDQSPDSEKIMYDEETWKALDQKFYHWNDRFEMTKSMLQEKQPLMIDATQLAILTVAQEFWKMSMTWGPNSPPPTEAMSSFLDASDALAQLVVVPGHPTFSLDGDLISGLSFVISYSEDEQLRTRALDMLRSLNRREGIWDSKEVLEMHEVALSLEDAKEWYEKEVPGGLPGFMMEVARRSNKLNPTNNILVTAGHYKEDSPSSGSC
ncbi:uncharacterized protein NECHADRAFT_102197 [Fusarium vanettenii 77-13-4]|uniref:Zn(2)-C6 fungal-type domain-containing protein n=1 Tax=Fusarium vanettenii (strain ATCC MYA-4622 / CBS 123669 / FGSC 9596 / NRRL 45880 / 77-13-4) TaxID=660122 RepID=C7ZDM6_FUSV7|nr:uncharacterized protein NECHADRAFT_102197 [Fusarium vanettenii 77-13-4]EEU37735.1 hypothetical protein NECHADRAFT_102197 [Fusarium vanettenii 77-13-4]